MWLVLQIYPRSPLHVKYPDGLCMWRLVLEPGETADDITPTAPGLRVVLDGGEIAEIVPGEPDRGMNLRPGEFYRQKPGVSRAVRNAGTARLELVEFELK